MWFSNKYYYVVSAFENAFGERVTMSAGLTAKSEDEARATAEKSARNEAPTRSLKFIEIVSLQKS